MSDVTHPQSHNRPPPRWLPLVAPILRERWAEMAEGPTPTPEVGPWLALLHTAETAPADISTALATLLQRPQSSHERQQAWATLTRLFSFTFEAAQSVASQLDSDTWRHLLGLQNQVLTVASQLLLTQPDRPSTGILTRRALYLQTVTELNQKIFEEAGTASLLNEVVTLLQENFAYDYVTLFLFNPAQQNLTVESVAWKKQSATLEIKPLRPATDHSATAQAAASGQLTLYNDLASAGQAHPLLPNIQTHLAIPLTIDETLLGVLDIASDRADAFSKDDLEILQALADHVAVAIENLRLQQALQRQIHEQKVIYESNVALGTTLDVPTTLERITQQIINAFEVGAVVICHIDEARQTTTALAQTSATPSGRIWRDLNQPVPLSQDPISQRVLQTNRPVIGQTKAGQLAYWQKPYRWGTILALPFKLGKQMNGLIEIYDTTPERTFSADDIELCQVIATQSTLALERVRLFEETRQRLNQVAILYTMARKIAGNLDLPEVMRTIVTALRQIIDCRGCCIFLLNRDENILEIKAADGVTPYWQKKAKLRVGEGVAGSAVAQNQMIYLPDTRQDPDFIVFDETVRSILVTPLTANNEVIGAINVDDDRPHAFGPTQEQLLKIAAAQIGIAIENARLFAKISAEQQQNQAIIQHMADGLLVIDRQGKIVACNPALMMMLDLARDQIIGQQVGSPNLPPHLTSITAIVTRQARTGVLAKEVTLRTRPARTLQIFATRMIDDNKQPLGEVRVVHDVTKEREVERLKADFMSTISHELRTPLFSIQGFAQILREDWAELERETRQEFLTTIYSQTVMLSDMVNNLLDLTKFDEEKLEFKRQPVPLLNLLRQASQKLQGFARQQQVDLVVDLPDTLPTIIGDPTRLEQVITNLLGNGIKFTEATGRVRLSASTSTQEVQVTVEDNGIGIPTNELKDIFSRYYQVTDKQKDGIRGTGLGLHIAKRIVEAHEGEIWAESQVGQGSIFHFTLPLTS